MDFEKYVTDKLEAIDSKVDDLCERTTRLETTYQYHVKDEVNKKAQKFKYITLILAIVTSLATVKTLLGF